MCDYSLEHVASREARVDDVLTTTKFSLTSGFSEVGRPEVAICLRPGTELAFDDEVVFETNALFFGKQQRAGRVARFRQVDLNKPYVHHDALEFPDGQIVLLTRLAEGQVARVLQTPSSGIRRDTKEVQIEHQPLETVR
jgi:hypothetical protein